MRPPSSTALNAASACTNPHDKRHPPATARGQDGDEPSHRSANEALPYPLRAPCSRSRLAIRHHVHTFIDRTLEHAPGRATTYADTAHIRYRGGQPQRREAKEVARSRSTKHGLRFVAGRHAEISTRRPTPADLALSDASAAMVHAMAQVWLRHFMVDADLDPEAELDADIDKWEINPKLRSSRLIDVDLAALL
jgi:hypothetical protein